MPSLPSPVRVAIGLAAAIADEAKTLPDRAIELPMLAVSRALQLSLRAQQRYAELAARGEQILATRQVTDEPPPWATFDDPVDDAAPATVQSLADRPARRARPRKTVHAPRNAAPSPFDAVGDEP
jgi:hypothetical protein